MMFKKKYFKTPIISFFISIIFFVCAAINIVSCGKVKLRKEKTKQMTNEKILEPLSLADEGFFMDGKGGLFNNLKWFAYSMETHIVWPLFDIYSIKTPHGVYLVQVTKYFSESGQAGILKIQIKDENNQKFYNMKVDAQGCGNPYTHPDHQSCINDPNQNIFSYIDLKNRTYKKMTDKKSLEDSDWDIAFKTTLVKLNSGTSGPSQVIGALAKRFNFFNDQANNPDVNKLVNINLQKKAEQNFKKYNNHKPLPYYLPDGIDRVIHEKFWYENLASGYKKLKNNIWWKVKSQAGDTIHSFNMKSIDEISVENNIETKLTIQFLSEVNKLKSPLQEMVIHFTTSNKLESICINFSSAESFICSPSRNDWDIKINVINQFKNNNWTREWRVFNQKGAKGPLQEFEI